MTGTVLYRVMKELHGKNIYAFHGERGGGMDKILSLGTKRVGLDFTFYGRNGNLCILLSELEDNGFIPYGALTVNLQEKLSDYFAYVDTNNIPEAQKFIEDYELGKFTGLFGRSGYCLYPLYAFDSERLRELSLVNSGF